MHSVTVHTASSNRKSGLGGGGEQGGRWKKRGQRTKERLTKEETELKPQEPSRRRN